jgi:hypothetical protein
MEDLIMNDKVNTQSTMPTEISNNVPAIQDSDANLVAGANNVGRIVGRTTVRVTRVLGIFLSSAYNAAKDEYDRVKKCNGNS